MCAQEGDHFFASILFACTKCFLLFKAPIIRRRRQSSAHSLFNQFAQKVRSLLRGGGSGLSPLLKLRLATLPTTVSPRRRDASLACAPAACTLGVSLSSLSLAYQPFITSAMAVALCAVHVCASERVRAGGSGVAANCDLASLERSRFLRVPQSGGGRAARPVAPAPGVRQPRGGMPP